MSSFWVIKMFNFKLAEYTKDINPKNGFGIQNYKYVTQLFNICTIRCCVQ